MPDMCWRVEAEEGSMLPLAGERGELREQGEGDGTTGVQGLGAWAKKGLKLPAPRH